MDYDGTSWGFPYFTLLVTRSLGRAADFPFYLLATGGRHLEVPTPLGGGVGGVSCKTPYLSFLIGGLSPPFV